MNSPLTQGNIGKHFAKYVSLNVVSMIGLSAYFLADTYFIANGVGPDGLTALNLILPVFSVVNGLGLMLGMGSATRYAGSRGHGDTAAGNVIFTQAALAAVILGVVITVAAVFFCGPLVRLLGADDEIYPLAKVYLLTLLCFSVMFLVNNMLISFVRNDGSPRLASVAMLTGSMANIVLDWVFIYPLNMGIFGAAFATGIAPVVSLCILSAHILKKNNGFHWVNMKPRPGVIWKNSILGLQSFINELSSGIVILVFNFTILSLAGNTGVAAYGIIANMALIVAAVFSGVAQGVQPLVSINYGAGNHSAVRRLFLLSAVTAAAFGAAFYLLGVCFPEPIAAAFNSENDPQLARITREGIPLYFLAFLVMGLNIVVSGFFAAVLKPLPSFVLSMLRGVVLVLPLALLLPKLWGMTGVWITIPCVELLTVLCSAALSLRYLRPTHTMSKLKS